MSLYGRFDQLISNGLVIRDGVIDWYFDRVLPVFQGRNYELFVISYEVSREKGIEQIKKRGDKQTVSAERLIALISDHDMHMDRFRKQYVADIILNDLTLFDHERVIKELRRRIREINSSKSA